MTTQPNSYDVGQTITLSCLFATGPTLGTIKASQNTLLVRDASGLTNGQPIYVAGAGAVGGDLFTTISAINGQTLTLAAVAQTDVALAVVGQLTDPTAATVTVRLPSLSEVSPSTSKLSTGRYTASLVASLCGMHFVRWTGTGPAAGVLTSQFVVRPQRVP